MLLNAIVIGGEVPESKFYDSIMGAEKIGHVVELRVLDADTTENHVCQCPVDFPGLEELKQLRQQGAPADVLRQRAAQLKANELPQQFATMRLEVLKLKGKQAAFLKLVCRFAQVASPVGA